jgi:hypothetical protein
MVHYETCMRISMDLSSVVKLEVNDKTGTFSRIGDHVLNVAMLLALSESLELKLKMSHLQEAISLCEPFVEISERAVRGIGKNTLAAQIGW